MNAECFENTLLGFADLVRDLWFEGMRIVFCYPVQDTNKEVGEDEEIVFDPYEDDWDHV